MTCESCVHWRRLIDPDDPARQWPPVAEWGECTVTRKPGDMTGRLTRFTYVCDQFEAR